LRNIIANPLPFWIFTVTDEQLFQLVDLIIQMRTSAGTFSEMAKFNANPL
jgi:hypothetical protein